MVSKIDIELIEDLIYEHNSAPNVNAWIRILDELKQQKTYKMYCQKCKQPHIVSIEYDKAGNKCYGHWHSIPDDRWRDDGWNAKNWDKIIESDNPCDFCKHKDLSKCDESSLCVGCSLNDIIESPNSQFIGRKYRSQ